MQTIRYKGEQLSVVFRSTVIERMTKHGFEPVEQIVCAILGNNQRSKGTGVALRAPSDPPNDAFGRELAFSRALDRLTRNFTDHPEVLALHGEFWEAFERASDGAKILPFVSKANQERIAELEQELRDCEASCEACQEIRDEIETLRQGAVCWAA